MQKPDKWQAAAWIAAFAAAGLLVLVIARASGSARLAFEAEEASLTGFKGGMGAVGGEDASGGSYVLFGSGAEAAGYGSDGSGVPTTGDCAVTVPSGQSLQSAVDAAATGAVICVPEGSRSGESVAIASAGVTLRATGSVTIRSASISAANVTIEGFTVVGGAYAAPRNGIVFSAPGAVIRHNLINGRGLINGIYCDRKDCSGALIASNTITNVESMGIYMDSSDYAGGSVIERNNIYDLYRTTAKYDVDGIRFFGREHVIRNNYIHDINEFKSAKSSSGDTPHADCFQTYNTFRNYADKTGASATENVVIENNYCVRVSRQCLIAENNAVAEFHVRDLTFRGNVCETYDNQVVNLKGVRAPVVENNFLLAGGRYHVVYLAKSPSGLLNESAVIQNNILMRNSDTMNFIYRTPSTSTGEVIRNNVTVTDPLPKTRGDAFQSQPQAAFSALVDTDFSGYKALAGGYDTVDRAYGSGVAFTVDIEGSPRFRGGAMDIGPWELR